VITTTQQKSTLPKQYHGPKVQETHTRQIWGKEDRHGHHK